MKSKKKKSTVGARPKPCAPGKAAKGARLDDLLVARGLADDLAEARGLIMSGKVVVGEQRVDKPGTAVASDVAVRVKDVSRFVSRGGDKLWAAVEDLKLAPEFKNATVLDVGASTGGFTHCALELGARAVVALDVGAPQLAWELRQDPRVTTVERTDVRDFDASDYAPFDWVVADVSFNALARLASALRRVAPRRDARFLLLVKPQFELPREAVPRGGVVTDPAAREAALVSVTRALAAVGIRVVGSTDSRVPGRAGNTEIFVYARSDA